MIEKNCVVDIAGLGPGGSVGLPLYLAELISASDVVAFRTTQHPGVDEVIELARSRGKELVCFDEYYSSAQSFEEVYAGIVEDLVSLAQKKGRVLYLVPGSPNVGEATAVALSNDERVTVVMHSAMSFLELAWDHIDADPISGITIVDSYELLNNASGYLGKILAMQCYSRELAVDLSSKVSMLDNPSMVILSHLGMHDEQVVVSQDGSWPSEINPDHLTSVFIPGWDNPIEQLGYLWDTIQTLRNRCPWDAEQTHQSLTRHLVEETHEVLEAIDEVSAASNEGLADSMSHLSEELGDLLTQVFFHANLARESGWFSISEVAQLTNEKLIFRHPHVFGDVVVNDSSQVATNWEILKKAEKGRKSVLEGIPKDLPISTRVAKLYRKLNALGSKDYVDRVMDELSNGVENERFSEGQEKFLSSVGEALDEGLDLDEILRYVASYLEAKLRGIESVES